MSGGTLRPKLILITLLLLTGTNGGEEKKEGSEKSSPPADDSEKKDPPPSPPEDKKPPEKKEEKPNQKEPANTPPPTPPPAEEKVKDDPPSSPKDTKAPVKEKEKTKKEKDSSNDNKSSSQSGKEKDKNKKKENSDKEKKSSKSAVDVDSTSNTASEDSWLVSMMKMVDKKGMVTKLVTDVHFKDLPDDLTGKSEEDIMGYVKILDIERESIQQRFLFDMGLKMLVGVVSYEYYNHNMLLPPLRYLAENDINLSASIEQQWAEHQDRLADFLVRVMELRKVDVKTLPKSQLGVPLMKLNREKDAVVSFPVWRTEAGAELPADAKQIGTNSRALLKNFWVN